MAPFRTHSGFVTFKADKYIDMNAKCQQCQGFASLQHHQQTFSYPTPHLSLCGLGLTKVQIDLVHTMGERLEGGRERERERETRKLYFPRIVVEVHADLSNNN